MKKILVIGASGFVGRRLAKGLLAAGYAVRCMARTPAKLNDLATAGCEIIKGDMSELPSVQQALTGADAVYISVTMLSQQNTDATTRDFMAIEINGLQNIITACRENNVHRLIYLTAMGSSPGSASAWGRGRWKAEQMLFNSGLDVTVLRPGMIVGVGGGGFNAILGNAKKRFAVVIGSGRQLYQCIAVDDLIYYLVSVLNEQRTYGLSFNVGSDDRLSNMEMMDKVAEIIGRPRPRKLHIPMGLLQVMAPLIERLGKLPKGALKGLMDEMDTDMIGDPTPLRAILPKPLLSFRQAVERTLNI